MKERKTLGAAGTGIDTITKVLSAYAENILILSAGHKNCGSFFD
jgi:hypothetical protein